jgi:hypothetical protein
MQGESAGLHACISAKTLCSSPLRMAPLKEPALGLAKRERLESQLNSRSSAPASRPSTFRDPVLKRPGMQGLSNLLSSLPAATAPPEVLQVSALSVNNVSTLEEYVVRTEHRHGLEDPSPHAEPGTPPQEAAFVPLDQLPISICIDTAHGVACPWNPQAASLLRHEDMLTTLRAPPTAGGRSRHLLQSSLLPREPLIFPGRRCMDLLGILTFSSVSVRGSKGQ